MSRTLESPKRPTSRTGDHGTRGRNVRRETCVGDRSSTLTRYDRNTPVPEDRSGEECRKSPTPRVHKFWVEDPPTQSQDREGPVQWDPINELESSKQKNGQ